eukprot:TRINITY_DN2765_c0_g1_i1.p1 TRINITY_DN2765_c0_g1~~TRINITY_DN2765_c0_g1_i1.p1  ORF type:complete len:871 (-),score=165.03 TRINITY_DN2765_c0_g1_i1:443-3055(-)
MVVLEPCELPRFVAASSGEVDGVIKKLAWWPHRLICRSGWHVVSCEFPFSLKASICSFLPPPNLLRQLGQHLRNASGGESVFRRTCAITHACLKAMGSQDLQDRVRHAAEFINDHYYYEHEYGWGWSEYSMEVLRQSIKSVMVIRYASRSHRDYPTHVAEILGQLVDGRYFHYQDMHPQKDWPLTVACSLWADDDGSGSENSVDVDSSLDALQDSADCLVLTLGRDLLTVLQQLDHRTLQHLVMRPEAGQYKDGPCGCSTCRSDAAIEKFDIQGQVQMYAALESIRGDLEGLYTEAFNNDECSDEDDGGASASDRDSYDNLEPGSWLPLSCSKTIEWALELLENQKATDYVFSEDLLDVQSRLEAVQYASEANDDGELRRGTYAFEDVENACNELRSFLICTPASWQHASIDSLSFTEASCSSVFLEGPRAGKPLAVLLEELKTGDVFLSEFDFDVVKLGGNTYVLGKQCELWCLKEYMLWASQQDPAVDVETVEVNVWPVVPSVKFKHGDVDPLQHFLASFSTACGGVSIDLTEPTPGEIAMISALAETGVPADLQNERGRLAHDVELVEELWTLVSTLEEQVASLAGKNALGKIRGCLCELQSACGSQNESIVQTDNQKMPIAVLQKGHQDSEVQDKQMAQGPVATVDPEEAANIVEACWVTAIEARIAAENSVGSGCIFQQSCKSGNAGPLQVHPAGSLVVLCFNRHPGAFDRALIDSPLAQELASRGVDVHPPWANGAKILAEGVDPFVLDEARVIPAPWHVIVREFHEHEVYKTLRASLPYEIRPKLKRGCEKLIVHDSDPKHEQARSLSPRSSCGSSAESFELQSAPASSSEDIHSAETLVLIKRTFIHVEVRREESIKSAKTC